MTVNDQLNAAVSSPVLARTVRGSGPGLLLAHGTSGSVSQNFGPILDHLAADYTVVGVDYPGSGDTARSLEPLTTDELADGLVAAADAEGLEKFAILAYSLGGPIAIRAAVRHPERVSALVLTATFAHSSTRLRLAASNWKKLYESGDRLLLAGYVAQVAFGTTFLDAVAAQLHAMLPTIAEMLPPGTPEQTDLVTRVDVREDLAEIAIPTLVILTTDDHLVPEELQRQLATDIAGATLVEIDSGHLVFAERHDEWQRLITTFLGELHHAS